MSLSLQVIDTSQLVHNSSQHVTIGENKKTTNTEQQQIPKDKGKANMPRSKEHKVLRIPGLRSQMKEKPSEGMEKRGAAGKKRKLWIPPGTA